MKNVSRIDTVFVPVTNVGKSEEWYLKMFQFRIVYRSNDGQYVGFRFDQEGPLQCGLTIYKCEAIPEQKHIPFNFYVSDVEEMHRMLKESNVWVSDIHEGEGMKFFDFADPDGNVLGAVTF
ncbi:VOC family protein [Cohnella endophytica]|uniref:VOC family protein n=1 Tax=Cohnella endophytica TaxID=2419778 RepID=A0A494Y169_9BACL|nr:VOC family protein [Cohnella endophytica]RKP54082.1 VOC family protein [Cohnella endophytica]